MSSEELIQKAIEEWASIAGGPVLVDAPHSSCVRSQPTLAHYIEAKLDADYVPRSLLAPLSSWSRKWNDDGSLRCNHSDAAGCTETGHTTVMLYELRESPARAHPPTEQNGD